MTAPVGREHELARLRSLLGGKGPSRATLVADAGMGKTTVVEALIGEARSLDITVLRAKPLETERQLGFSGLLDLFGELSPETYDSLPPPQRTAIRAALLLDQHPDGADPRAVAAAVRGVLQGLAAVRRVILVIDDAHWLDAGTAGALGQAMSRITQGVGVLAASRPSGRPVEGWLGKADLDCVLEPMTEAELFEVVRRHLGAAPNVGELRAVTIASGGNPLHALELARHRAGTPSSFDQLLGGRVERLDRGTRLALLAAALASAPSVDLVASARELDPVETLEVLEEAIRAGLVTVETRVRFRHPLYAQAVIDGAALVDVTETHRRLAQLEPLLESRAWHQGVAHPLPEAGLALELEAAARSARARGAWESAIDLLELSVRRSPQDDPGIWARALELAGWLHLSGRPEEAETWFRKVWEAGPSELRWEAGIGLAEVLVYLVRTPESLEVEDALSREDLPELLRVRLVVRVQAQGDPSQRDIPALLSHARELLAGLPSTPEVSGLLGNVLVAEAELRRGRAEPYGSLLEQAEHLERSLPGVRVLGSAAQSSAHSLTLCDRHDEARSRFTAIRESCEDNGDDFSVPLVLAQAAYLERRAGRWDRALELMREGGRSAAGQGQLYQWLLEASQAGLEGLRGDRNGSVATLERLWPLVHAAGEANFEVIVLQLLGQVHLAYREDEQAWTALARGREIAETHSLFDPADVSAVAHLAEAGLFTGRLDEVESLLRQARERATAMGGRENVLIGCQQVEVGLLAARGDLEAAVGAIEAMLEAHDRGPVEAIVRARAHLTAGKVYRRALHKRLAHERLTQAVALFDELGCPPYAAQARAELGRVGLRPRSGTGLTDTERQVCELAVSGLRNREIAERSFIAVKTVESILARSYMKLGIRTRSELARALDRAGRRPESS